MANGAPAHVTAATPLLRLISILLTFLGSILLIGGIYLASAERLAETNFSLFGNDFSSTSVGVSMAFIGVILIVLTIRSVLRALVSLGKIPDS